MDKIKVPFLDSYLLYTLIVFAYTICIYNVLSLLMFMYWRNLHKFTGKYTKCVIRSRKSKDREHNGKITNNDL